jgi:hypothetical protein
MASDRELALAAVSAEFAPDWYCYDPGVNGLVYAKLAHVTPPVLVRGEDPQHLRDEIIRVNSERAEARFRQGA